MLTRSLLAALVVAGSAMAFSAPSEAGHRRHHVRAHTDVMRWVAPRRVHVAPRRVVRAFVAPRRVVRAFVAPRRVVAPRRMHWVMPRITIPRIVLPRITMPRLRLDCLRPVRIAVRPCKRLRHR